jgi:hypothetical protein
LKDSFFWFSLEPIQSELVTQQQVSADVGTQTVDDLKAMAKFVAIVVRNAMESFHADHLSDAQMRELNPLIRNAIFTALHAARMKARSETASHWIDSQIQHIPSYWESPELLEGYVQSMERFGEDLKVV